LLAYINRFAFTKARTSARYLPGSAASYFSGATTMRKSWFGSSSQNFTRG